MISIGIDLSYSSTGVVCLQDDKIKGTCKIKTEPCFEDIRSRLNRINSISQQIQDFIANSIKDLGKNYIPEIIFIEGYSFNSRSGMCFSIGELGGIVKQDLEHKSGYYAEIPPTQLKKFITGKGNCEKNLMLLKTFKRWGEEFDGNDICDAYGLAIMGYCIMNYDTLKLLKHERDVLYKIKQDNYILDVGLGKMGKI